MRLMAIALACGVALGLAAVFGMEFLDRRVRSADDLAQMLQMPVLSVVPDLTAPPRKRLGFWRRPALPSP
jgi:capsular polysaccharide biosynthesis protein